MLNLTSEKLVVFIVNSIGNSLICSDIWHKHHQWYFKIVLYNFTSRSASEVWGNFEISQVIFMPNITYNSWCYLFILLPGKFSHLTPRVYFRRVVSLRRRANWFWSSCFRPRWSRLSQVDVLFSVFWFSEFSFSSWISWFQNLKIFPQFLHNSCDESIKWQKFPR